jgi:mannose-1-phosphate guanylyltransferase
MPITDAVILAGGFGTRLRPLTTRTPKPLLSVGGRPFLESLFARLAQAGVRRAVLSVHHNAALLRRALPGLRLHGLRVSLCREPAPLGTGGAIRYAWPDPAKACLVLNGDVLSDFDMRRLQESHGRGKALATLWTIPVKDTRAFGVVETDRGGRVTRFVEKPKPGESPSRMINAGMYALEPAVRARIAAGRSVSVEREVFPLLLEQGLALRTCASAASVYWNDIGTPASFLRASQDLLRGRLWKGRGLALRIWGRPDRAGNLLAPSARVAAGADLDHCVVDAGCRVAAGAVLRGSVLLRGSRVGAESVLDGALLAEGAVVGARCSVRPGCVLGPGTRLSDDTRI